MKSNNSRSPFQRSSPQKNRLPIKKEEKEEIIPTELFSIEDRESTPVEAYLSQTNEEEEPPELLSQDFLTIMTRSVELDKSTSLICSSGTICDV